MKLTNLVRPRGQHRSTPDMTVLEAAIATGDAEPGAMAWCPECARSTYHALHTDRSRTCWTCRTETEA